MSSGIRCLLVVGVCLFALSPRISRACASAQCSGGVVVPGNGSIVPANLPALRWYPLTSGSMTLVVTSANVRLTSTDDGLEIPVGIADSGTASYDIAPIEGLIAGSDYGLAAGEFCQGVGDPADPASPTHVNFRTSAVASLPVALGELVVGAPLLGALSVATNSGSCTRRIVALKVLVELGLDGSASPWKDVLLFDTLVDGNRWRPQHSLPMPAPAGSSWEGRGRDILYGLCPGFPPAPDFDPGLSEGPHTVVMRATLPGTAVILETAPVTVVVDCQSALPEADGGASDGSDGVVDAGFTDRTEAPPPDLGLGAGVDPATGGLDAPPHDASERADAAEEAGIDASNSDAKESLAGRGGCSCSWGVEPQGSTPIFLVSLFLLSLRRRPSRRRRSRRAQGSTCSAHAVSNEAAAHERSEQAAVLVS